MDFLNSKNRIIISGIVLLILIITLIFYFTRSTSEEINGEIAPVDAVTPSPAVTLTVIQSPVSPLSPVSPASPLTPGQSSSAEIEALIQRGIALYESQNYQEASSIIEEALALAPDNILAQNAQGSIYMDTKDYEKAIENFSNIIEQEPLFPYAHYNRGRAYYLQEKYDEALADLEKSIELSPGEFGYRANGNIGLIHHERDEYDKALEVFTESITYNVNERADIYYFRGETYTILENYEAAIADYEAAIERFPDYDLAYQSVGYVYYKTDQFDKALEALNQALEISSEQPGVHYYLMLVYLEFDEFDQAETEAAQAADLLNNLSDDEREILITRIINELERLAEDHPDQEGEINKIMEMIPIP